MYNYKTSKLFWGKYPYKIVINGQWIYGIRNINVKNLESVIDKKLYISDKVSKAVASYPERVVKMVCFLSSHEKDQVSFRCEGSTLAIFFKDRSLFDTIQEDFGNDITSFYEPENDTVLEYLYSNIRTEVRDFLTHGCRYKVNLKALSRLSNSNKESFLRLVNDNENQFRMTARTRELFAIDKKWYGDGSFFYVKDSKYLLMVQMLIQPAIKEVIKIVTPKELKKEEVNAE